MILAKASHLSFRPFSDGRGIKAIRSNRDCSYQAAVLPSFPPSPDLFPGQIDKSVLTLAEPKRLRDKGHLRFVASQPCLICGCQPSDPHHLRFAQPRALGLKVSDEFTGPLCRGHHRQLHQAGNEIAWWHDLDINALKIAKELWEESHANSTPIIDAKISQADNGSSPDKANSSALRRSREPPQLALFTREVFLALAEGRPFLAKAAGDVGVDVPVRTNVHSDPLQRSRSGRNRNAGSPLSSASRSVRSKPN